MSTYTAEATRGEGWWVVQLREEPGLLTQTRRLDQIPDMVRDALELFPELESDPASAIIDVVVTGDLEAQAAYAREKTNAALKAREEANAAMRAAVKSLSERGLSLTDIGSMLGVSYQRAQQLSRA